jgi:hypothetical protein
MGKRKRTVLLTPVIESRTLELAEPDAPGGLLFRKRILPLKAINYPEKDGRRRVVFDREFHRHIIDAFQQKAVELPTLQLAGPNNEHNMDPARTAGEVVELSEERPDDVDGPGLYATLRARNERHAQLLKEMPRLGVSAQVIENREGVDGRKFRAALRHVLVTADPRVVGLGPWRSVSLSSDDDGPVIDLSDAEYEEMDPMPDIPTADGILSLSDDEIAEALEAAAGELGEGDDPDDETNETSLSAPTGRGRGGELVLDLAARLEASETTTTGLMARLAASDWKAERLSLSNAGVPKADLDTAEKVLAYPGETVVSLSNEDGRQFGEDARKVIRDLLELRKGTIDLSSPRGSAEPEPLELSNADGDDAFQAAWEQHSGF